MKTTLRLTVLLVLALGVLPSLLRGQDASKGPRLITVSGEAEVRVVPTEVSLRFRIQTKAKTLAQAKTEHDGRMKKVQAVLRNAEIEAKDTQTIDLTMGPDYEEIKDKSVLVGYEVSQSLSVLLRDLSKYEALMAGLLEAGVNRVEGVDFRAGEMRKYNDEARVLAVRAAREKAALLAGELNQKLGRPHSITEENPNQDYPKQYANVSTNVFGFASSVAAGDATISGGQLVVRAKVSVRFELQD
ncbi:MAG: SIMPL domain-containing protein [Acidobacteria bacterium]|nr:SIMPL domain-containing protein [Acidobacteriota bacterium]MBI3662490.1 SIMPL domain-containing protein [Acidobacteriota bacterium]